VTIFKSQKKKTGKTLIFFKPMQWATVKFMSEVHLWLSFGYLFELAVPEKIHRFYAPLKFSSSLRSAIFAT